MDHAALEALEAQLREGVDGYGERPMPDRLDKAVDAVVRHFRSTRVGVTVSPEVAAAFSSALLTYSSRAAARAVRTGSEPLVADGLAALALDSGRMDARDATVHLAPLYDACERLGLDGVDLFSTAADLATQDFASVLRRFPHRDAQDRSLDAMGLVASRTPDGLVYRNKDVISKAEFFSKLKRTRILDPD